MRQSGNLDRFISFYAPIETTDDFNQPLKTYNLAFEDWAERKDLETIKDSERVMNGTHRVAFSVVQFKLRYRDDINAKMRIKDDDGVWFEIVSTPIVQDRRHWIIINCEQRDDI